MYEKKDKFNEKDLLGCTNVIFVDQHLEIESVTFVIRAVVLLVW